MPPLKKIIDQFKKKNIALQIVQLDDIMKKMVVDIKKWFPDLDLVDMAPILKEQ